MPTQVGSKQAGQATAQEPPLESPPEPAAPGTEAFGGAAGKAGHRAEGEVQWRKRRVKLGRRQDKFPPWVRALLWMGAPAMIWLAIYAVGRMLL